MKSLLAEFRKSVKVRDPHSTAILKHLPQHKELRPTLDDYKKKAEQVCDHLRQLVEDEKSDPVAQNLFALWDDSAVTILEIATE